MLLEGAAHPERETAETAPVSNALAKAEPGADKARERM